MTKTGKQGRNGKAGTKAFAGFDLDNPELPQYIEENALRSGGFPYDEKLKRKAYEEQLLVLQLELLKFQSHVERAGLKGGGAVRGPRYVRQRRVHLALPRAHEPAACPLRRLVEADRSRTRPVVLPALHRAPADGGQSRAVRPLLVQPGRRRAGDGVCHRGRGGELPARRARVRGAARATAARDCSNSISRSGGRCSSSASTSAATIPSSNGRSPRSTSRPWTNGTTTRAPKQTCSASRIPPRRPWIVIHANDQRRARLEAIRAVLIAMDYEGKDEKAIGALDPKITSVGPVPEPPTEDHGDDLDHRIVVIASDRSDLTRSMASNERFT